MNVVNYVTAVYFSTILVSYVACPAVPYYSTSRHNVTIFREQLTEYLLCVLI